jgi:23S rRNA (adenine2503-C2)-methyltransferase
LGYLVAPREGAAVLHEILESARESGAAPEHVRALLTTWLAGGELDLRVRGFPASKRLLAALPQLRAGFDTLARVRTEHPSADGSRRLLIELADGATVEAVLLARGGLCISTQVGCAVGCVFCKTGEGGLVRHVNPGEMLAQVALARARAEVRRVVLMGMGEPAHNLENVLAALRVLGAEGRLAHKHIVFSTVGERAAIEALRAHSVRPALALSLHTTKPDLRRELLPRAPRLEPREVLELALDYADATTWPLQVQWTLLEGLNDGDDELETLAAWLAGRRSMVNFIPWNQVEGMSFARPGADRGPEMVRFLRARGVIATLRRSGGQDVEGACGQLRARSLPVRRRANSAPQPAPRSGGGISGPRSTT